jgi:magnesium chelatase family protein
VSTAARPAAAARRQILQVHTAAGLQGLPLRQRPLRAPHHSSSCASLLGGGIDVRPGEVTLAHHGVLFLDELPEFRRDTLEALRQPLEDGIVTIGRAQRTVRMPASFTLVAAMNPCPCGYRGHPQRPCQCSPPTIARYRNRISGPLLDRIDLQVEVPALDPSVFAIPRDASLSTEVLAAKIQAARARQSQRNRALGQPGPNSALDGRALEEACAPLAQIEPVLQDILRLHRLGGRARVRLLRVARTLADLSERDTVLPDDLLEAAALRGYARLATV